MSHECPQTLHYALILVLFLAIIKLPGLLTLSFKLIELDCMHHCANQRVKPVELTDIMVTACALLINVLLAPVVGQMISTQLFHDSIVGTVLAIFMPFLLAALILVLPCPTGIHIGYKIDSFDDDFSEEHDHLADDEHHP